MDRGKAQKASTQEFEKRAKKEKGENDAIILSKI